MKIASLFLVLFATGIHAIHQYDSTDLNDYELNDYYDLNDYEPNHYNHHNHHNHHHHNQLGRGVVDGSKRIINGMYETVRHPITAVKGAATAIRHPRTSLQGTKEEIRRSCKENGLSYCIGQFGAQLVGFALPGVGEAMAGARVASSVENIGRLSDLNEIGEKRDRIES